jgi:CheY-like chemotaxis protein
MPGRLHILLVEDDPSVAEMYKLKLEIDGYRVTVAGDGEEGLRFAQEQRPQMIFLDVRLPKMDGMSVLEVMRGDDRTRHIPVVILSNYSETPLIERGLGLGAREYLIKSETTPSFVSARAKTYALRLEPDGKGDGGKAAAAKPKAVRKSPAKKP